METTSMMNLVSTEGDGRFPVSGRTLHENLEIKTAYKDWFPRMAEYGFEENRDYCSFLSDRSDGLPGKPRTEHLLSLDCAKHICMIQRTPIGMKVRQYLIEVESSWQSEDRVLERAMNILHRRLDESNEKVKALEGKVIEMRPKEIFADAVSVSDTCILIGELAKILKGNGIETGQNRLFEQLRDDGYLISRKGTDFNMPTQKSMELGLFKVKETAITHSNGSVSICKTTKVTGKGQQYFINHYVGSKEIA